MLVYHNVFKRQEHFELEKQKIAAVIYCFYLFRLDIENCYNKKCFSWFVL